MKARILIVVGMLMACVGLRAESEMQNAGTSDEGILLVYCTPDLQSMATTWAAEYNKAHPGIFVKVEVTENLTGTLEDGRTLCFASGPLPEETKAKEIWVISVGRDILVPVISSDNPWLKQINVKGVTSEAIAGLFGEPAGHTWGQIVPEGKESPVKIYLGDEEIMKDGFRAYTGLEDIPAGITLSGAKDVVAKVQADPLAIGFCRLSDVTGDGENGLAGNISLLPIDLNGNGKMDYFENIYGDADAFARGVWIGKYPKSLYREIYSLSAARPENESGIAFLTWIVTDGQKYLVADGFSELVLSEQQSKLDRINNVSVYVAPVERVFSIPKVILLITAAVLMLGLIIGTVMRNRRPEMAGPGTPIKASSGLFDENSIMAPKGLYFDKTHTWAFMEKDGSVKIGIDDFLQHVTGTITRVDLRKPGEKIQKGEALMSIIQRGKTLKIYSPVTGTIIQQNQSLLTDATLINNSPFSEGWVYTVEPANWQAEIRILSMADKYVKWIYDEFARLKDFLAISLDSERHQYAKVVLQDGGVLKDNILEDLGPELWEDFQTDFLDAGR